jgi:hypothetical protein
MGCAHGPGCYVALQGRTITFAEQPMAWQSRIINPAAQYDVFSASRQATVSLAADNVIKTGCRRRATAAV